MSDSEFEFEDDDCDVYSDDGAGADESAGTRLPDKLIIENAYYEAEDVVSHGPAKAVELFTNLYKLLEEKQSSTSSMAVESLLQWRIKVLQHLIKLPGPDVSERSRYFTELLRCLENIGVSVDSSSVLAGALDAFDSRMCAIDDPAVHQVIFDIYQAAAKTASTLGNINALQSTTIRTGHFLAKIGDLTRTKAWLCEAYLNWMTVQQRAIPILENWKPDPSIDILHDPYLYAAINQSPAEDSHILGILALDLDYCRQIKDDLRPTKMMPKCKNIARALVDRRTLALLRENIGKFDFCRGSFDEAYRAFYDTWESAFALGNTRQACTLLLRLILCNLLSDSKIDPLSTREAKTLLGTESHQVDGNHLFHKHVDFLTLLRKRVQESDVTETKRLLWSQENALDADPFLAESNVKDELMIKVRRQKLAECCRLWADMKVSWLREKLEFESDDEVRQFCVQAFSSNMGATGIVLQDDILVKQKDPKLETLTAITDICEDLLKRAQVMNMEIL